MVFATMAAKLKYLLNKLTKFVIKFDVKFWSARASQTQRTNMVPTNFQFLLLIHVVEMDIESSKT